LFEMFMPLGLFWQPPPSVVRRHTVDKSGFAISEPGLEVMELELSRMNIRFAGIRLPAVNGSFGMSKFAAAGQASIVAQKAAATARQGRRRERWQTGRRGVEMVLFMLRSLDPGCG